MDTSHADEPLDVSTALELARAAVDDAVTATQTAQTGSTLVPTGADQALAVKAQMSGAHASLAKAQRKVIAAQERAKDAIKRQQAELDAQMRAMELQLAPLKEQIAKYTEGIWTMNLYLGRDEEIHTLTEGAPAPAGTPIYVRQQVLAMDEESAIAAEGGGIDVRNIDAFDQWLTSDPAHLAQVLPEERGVVAIMARRKERDYGNVWDNVHLNEANQSTWWLIRNGENLYRMQTDFSVGARLVPARTEFTSMFVDPFTKEPLQPGTHEWMKAEKAAGARERHFMRVALILQGLIDRTAVFAPLPKVGVSLLSPQDYDEGHVVLIADDENQIGTGRMPFYDWLRAKNSELRTGMRIVFTSRHQDWPKRYNDRGAYQHHERISPPGVETPRTGVYTLERRGDSAESFVFLFQRTREEWMRNERGHEELRVPKTRASVTIMATDRFVIPVDLVTVEEMTTYLTARTERHAYADMFPALKAAIAFKEAEAAAESPFRDLLAAQVAQAEGIDLEAAHAAVAQVITTWKVGARWFRPLSGDADAEARAGREILTERARIVAANAGAGDDIAFVARARREHPDALLIARKKDGKYVVLTPSVRAWVTTEAGKVHDSVPHDVWVDRHEYTRTGKASLITRWQIVAPAAVSRWITLHTSEAWSTWKKHVRATAHLSDPEILAAIETIKARTFDGLELMAIGYQDEEAWHGYGMTFKAWYHPGPVTVPARLLTDGVPALMAHTVDLRAKKDRTGAVSLRWYLDRPAESDRWSTPFNSFLDADRTARPSVPWSDNSGNRLVHVDDEVFARARTDADAWESARHAAAELDGIARRLLAGPTQQWHDARLAEAKARFLEDYVDEALWEDHAKTLRIDGNPLERGDMADAVARVVRRLVEDGERPWGLTIAQAVAKLGEEPVVTKGPHWATTTKTVEISADLLALRLADEPAQDSDPATGE